MPQTKSTSETGGNGQKSPSSPVLSYAEGKAAASLARGAYSQYVSTAKWRPACAKPLGPLARQSWLQRRARRQGTPLAAFFNISILVKANGKEIMQKRLQSEKMPKEARGCDELNWLEYETHFSQSSEHHLASHPDIVIC
jgi:hypothetical protein